MDYEVKLLSLLNRSFLDEKDANAARGVAAKIRWDRFCKLSETNAVVPLTYRRLQELGLGSKIPPIRRWDEIADKIRRAGVARVPWIQQILTKANAEKIPVILLKGSLLASQLYKDPGYKKMNDVDLLVKPEHAERFMKILVDLDFQNVGPILGKGEVSDDDHHAPPFISSDLSCIIGLHWGLVSPHSRWKPCTEEIWRDAKAITVWGVPAWRMSWEDTLLHLCVHLPFFKLGLRELADVYNVARDCKPRMNWTRFQQKVLLWKAEDAAYRVLALAGGIAPLGFPEELLTLWKSKSNKFTVRDTKRRLAASQDLLEWRSTHVAKIEKAFAVFRLSRCYEERLQAWAKTWSLTLWPDRRELQTLTGHSPERPLPFLAARLRAPASCLYALCRDHGAGPIAYITAANAASIFKDTILKPFRKNHPRLLDGPAGLILKTLE